MITNHNDVVIINLTSRDIKVYPQDNMDIPFPIAKHNEENFLRRCLVIPSSGSARCETFRDSESVKIRIKSSPINIPISFTNFGVVTGLPPEKENTIIVVPQLVCDAVHHLRKDVYMIDKPVRSDKGVVLACMAFSRPVYSMHNNAVLEAVSYLNKRMVKLTSEDIDEREKLMNLIVSLNKYIQK